MRSTSRKGLLSEKKKSVTSTLNQKSAFLLTLQKLGYRDAKGMPVSGRKGEGTGWFSVSLDQQGIPKI